MRKNWSESEALQTPGDGETARLQIGRVARARAIFFAMAALAMLISILVPAKVWANDAQIASGQAWLSAQVQANGQVNTENISLALPFQVRGETLHALAATGATPSAALVTAAETASTAPATEVLARRIRAMRTANKDARAEQTNLIALQNDDGGFGAAQGHASNPLDSAWALIGLQTSAANAAAAQQSAERAVNWLLANQQSNGSWLMAVDEDGIVPTALAVQALQHYRSAPGVTTAQARARTWLDAQKQANHSWGRADLTAQALLALVPAQTSTNAYADSTAQLIASQMANGSWLDDAYTTALVLRALFLANQPVISPEVTNLRGVIVDEATSQPIAGAQVTLQVRGLSVQTDASGGFAFDNLQPGAESIRVQANGYLTLVADLALANGQQLDLGTIGLKAASAANASVVTITGVARYSEDGITHQPAANATITVAGLSATTNAAGEYTLANVPPGTLAINAAYSNFAPIDVSVDAVAGQQVRFDPSFVRVTGQNTLRVTVRDEVSGSAIAAAAVVLNSISRATNDAGEAYFASGVETGENTVTVTAHGYDSRIITINVQGVNSIRLPVTLRPVASGAPAQTVLKGVITDAETALPLAGVSIRLEGTSHAATSSAQGQYEISGQPDFAGVRKLVIEKAGYHSHEQTVTITSARTHQFDVPLQPKAADSAQPTQMVVNVVDRSTQAPVSGAVVELSGSNPQSVETDAAGRAVFDGLNAGTTQIQVSAPGYENTVVSVQLETGRSYQIPMELRPFVAGGHRIFGKVFDAQSRRPLAGVEVALGGVNTYNTVTDANGVYEFADIPLGRWNVAAITRGYKGKSLGFDMKASTEVDIALPVDWGMNALPEELRTVVAAHPNILTSAVGYLFVFGTEGTTGSVMSNDGEMNHVFAIDSSGVAEVMVPSKHFLSPSNEVRDQALFVYANSPVSASFLNRDQYTTDMTYLLDVAALGNEYRVLGWYYTFGLVQLSLTAVEDDTVAVVTPSTNLSSGQQAGEPFEIVLNKGQSVLLTAPLNGELTGTSIRANRSLAVFSGAQCAVLPVGFAACDHLFTQLPPVSHWATEYVIPETANTGRAGNLVRILAHVDGTEVTVNDELVATLSAGEFHEIYLAKDLHITANHPVLVGQFLKGFNATGHGDPAFSYVPGIDQTLKDYVFTAPANLTAYKDNFLNLAVPTGALPSLQLNDAAVDTFDFRPIGSTGYSAGHVRVEPGPGRIRANQPFLATISGFTTFDSYHTIIGASYSTGASALDPVIAAVAVATDQQSYPANTGVQLQARVVNHGQVQANLRLVLRITDASGNQVEQFAGHNVGLLAVGASASHAQPWNTATYPAGTYTLIGTLLNSQGEVVDTSSTAFAITAATGGSGAGGTSPRAALSLSTNKAVYSQNDVVRIGNVVRNLTSNAHFEDARVELTVRAPGGATVFTHTHQLGQLLANAIRPLDVLQPLRDVPAGTYIVDAILIGSGNDLKRTPAKAYDTDVQLATATTTYVVSASGLAPTPTNPTNPGSGATDVKPVPLNQPWAIALMALLLAAAAACQRTRARKN